MEPRGRLARAKGPNGLGVARACQGTFETADLRHRGVTLGPQWIEGPNRLARLVASPKAVVPHA